MLTNGFDGRYDQIEARIGECARTSLVALALTAPAKSNSGYLGLGAQAHEIVLEREISALGMHYGRTGSLLIGSTAQETPRRLPKSPVICVSVSPAASRVVSPYWSQVVVAKPKPCRATEALQHLHESPRSVRKAPAELGLAMPARV